MLREYHSGSPPGRRCSLENCQGEDRAAPSLVVRTNSQPDGRVDVRRYGSEAASVPISSPATFTVHPPEGQRDQLQQAGYHNSNATDLLRGPADFCLCGDASRSGAAAASRQLPVDG